LKSLNSTDPFLTGREIRTNSGDTAIQENSHGLFFSRREASCSYRGFPPALAEKPRDFAGQNRAAGFYAQELPEAIPVTCF
jgi:hypothetical protein